MQTTAHHIICRDMEGLNKAARLSSGIPGSAVIAEDAVVLAQRDKTYRLFRLKRGRYNDQPYAIAHAS